MSATTPRHRPDLDNWVPDPGETTELVRMHQEHCDSQLGGTCDCVPALVFRLVEDETAVVDEEREVTR